MYRTVLFAMLIFSAATAFSEAPQKVTACELLHDAGKYDHQEIEVTAFFTHGFEESGFFDLDCDSRYGTWFEYGGEATTGTMYCCGVSGERTRPRKLEVEGISLGVKEDQVFRDFDSILHTGRSRIARATVVGRFFAGRKETWRNSSRWMGYGHLGCCSLLVIEEVKAVGAQNRTDLDYSEERYRADEVEYPKRGCKAESLFPIDARNSMVAAQRAAESGEQDWAFSDPDRVATETLKLTVKNESVDPKRFKISTPRSGQRIYRYRIGQKGYVMELAKPYTLTSVAKDPERIAWVVESVHEVTCKK